MSLVVLEEKNLFYFVFIFLKIIFIIMDLQCSVNFCSTAQWPSYTYTYILFLTLSFIMFHHKWLDIVPCALQQDLMLILSKSSSSHLSIPNSQSIPFPPSPSWQPQVCSPSPWVSLLRKDSLFHILDSRYKCYYMVFVFLFLTYFT